MSQIRTLAFSQPYGTLMLNGKIETRKVLNNRNPPFPLSKYLFYTTKNPISFKKYLDWTTETIRQNISNILQNNETTQLNGYAIAIGDLINIRSMEKSDEQYTYVQYKDNKTHKIWCLIFENIKKIEPFPWNYGKQGIGFVPESELTKIKYINI